MCCDLLLKILYKSSFIRVHVLEYVITINIFPHIFPSFLELVRHGSFVFGNIFYKTMHEEVYQASPMGKGGGGRKIALPAVVL